MNFCKPSWLTNGLPLGESGISRPCRTEEKANCSECLLDCFFTEAKSKQPLKGRKLFGAKYVEFFHFGLPMLQPWRPIFLPHGRKKQGFCGAGLLSHFYTAGVWAGLNIAYILSDGSLSLSFSQGFLGISKRLLVLQIRELLTRWALRLI